MEIKSTVLALADISGYTGFVTEHRTEVLHAEKIIGNLLESVIDNAEFPLSINKLEGDAVFFYAEIGEDDPSAVASSVLNQSTSFFQEFRRHEEDLIRCVKCMCDACLAADQLRLKVFLHVGDVAHRHIRNFEELSGEDVILIHRLMKNSVESREYLLMTETFHELSGGLADWESQRLTETYDQLGAVSTRVYYPPNALSAETISVQADPTFWETFKYTMPIMFYGLLRNLGLKKRRHFNHLQDV